MLLNRTRANQIMDREGLSAIVATTPINTYYLSSWATDASWGFGDMALVLLPRDEAALIPVEVDAGQPQQRDGAWMELVLGYARRPGNALSPFRLVDGMVLSCDLPFIGPEAGKFHFEDEVYLKDDRVEILNDSDRRLLACIGGRAVRID